MKTAMLGRAAVLCEMHGLYVDVERIARAETPEGESIRAALKGRIEQEVRGAGLRLLTIDEAKELPDAPFLMFDPGITRVTAAQGKTIGHFISAELALRQRVTICGNQQVVRAVTWQSCAWSVATKGQNLTTAVLEILEYLLMDFFADLWAANADSGAGGDIQL